MCLGLRLVALKKSQQHFCGRFLVCWVRWWSRDLPNMRRHPPRWFRAPMEGETSSMRVHADIVIKQWLEECSPDITVTYLKTVSVMQIHAICVNEARYHGPSCFYRRCVCWDKKKRKRGSCGWEARHVCLCQRLFSPVRVWIRWHVDWCYCGGSYSGSPLAVVFLHRNSYTREPAA